MMRYALALAVLLGSAHAARAQSTADVILVTSSQTSDMASTLWGLKQGASEGNPFGKSVVKRPMVAVALKSATSGYILYASRRLREEGHPKQARAVSWVSSAVFFAIAAHNVHVGRQMAAQRTR